MNNSSSPALNTDSLFSKSILYMNRGLRAKHAGFLDEYQLWASLALELLGKSTLSNIHPALIADPTHYQSLFSACGHPISPDVKTITAKTLFERLSHISKSFDKRIQKFCEQLALRRNSEIHSGESPFSGMPPELWEAKFWYAVHTMLLMQNKELEDWLNPDQTLNTKQLLEDAAKALEMIVRTKIEHALEDFQSKYKKEEERQKVLEESKKYPYWNHFDKFTLYLDDYQREECPSCKAMGIIGGSEYETKVSEDQDPEDPYTEYIEITYSTEEFYCFTCDLHLVGSQEIQYTTIPEEFIESKERERVFYDDYGND